MSKSKVEGYGQEQPDRQTDQETNKLLETRNASNFLGG